MITTLVFAPKDMAGLLVQAMPDIAPEKAANYGPALLETAIKYGINTPLRLAHFLAQIGHESGSLKYTEELASGAAYEGRKDLGNTQPGDGRRYKGRGLIQITGRYNYSRYGKVVPPADLVNRPERLAEMPYSVDSAGWFWVKGTSQDLNRIADKDNVLLITKLINGGHNGLSDRKRRLLRAKRAIEMVGTKKVQQALNAVGSYPTLLVDGQFGPRMASIVREHQSDWLEQITGDVNSSTWNKLKGRQ